jgi:5-methylcytosine-specific restriction enzyme A
MLKCLSVRVYTQTMPHRIPVHRPRPPVRQQPAPRPSAHQRGYGRRWRLRSQAFLHANPLCVECKAKGVLREATVVDHIVPHRGDAELFNDAGNWQGLCTAHHNAKTRRGE